jgi:hypothetical protein
MGATYGDLPTVMLSSQIVGDSIGIHSDKFDFMITAASGRTIIVEASLDLVNWQPIWTNTFSGTTTNFIDSQWAKYPHRYYRAR